MATSRPALDVIVVHADELTALPVRGNPNITKLAFFSDFAGGYLVGSSIAMQPFGQQCGLHNHRGAVELFVVLEGSGLIEVDGRMYELRKDSCVLVPPGAPHNLIGSSTEPPLRVFCAFVIAPGHETDETPWLPVEAV